MRTYNDSTLTIPGKGVERVIIKRNGCPPEIITSKKDGVFSVSTTNWLPGIAYMQLESADGAILRSERIDIIQNLATAPADFDPRSQTEITLDAIDAMLAGRATAQQRKVQLGDKSIEYSTLDELLQWRTHFQKLLRKERGEAASARRQLFALNEVNR